jgi:hypothetical protein
MDLVFCQRGSLAFPSGKRALGVQARGLFINDNGTRRNVKSDEKRKKPYLDLIGARILRPLDDNVKVNSRDRVVGARCLIARFAQCR